MNIANLNNIEKFLTYALVFLIGISIPYVVNSFSIDFERPFSPFFNSLNSSGLSPSDFLGEQDILIYLDKVVLKITGASVSRYEASGSMRPVLDKGANGIRVKPINEEQIHVGDIVSFKKKDSLVVHRVIEKGMDDEGIYFITKGDNNDFVDGKIRFEDIKYVTLGLIY